MAKLEGKAEEKSVSNRRGQLNIARDTDWYKKRRDEVPVTNRTGLKENPFKDLLKTKGSRPSVSAAKGADAHGGAEQGD